MSTARVDGRKGIDGLSALVRSQFAEDPLSGRMYVFFSRRADRVRVLYYDRDGYVLVTKRLERGTYEHSVAPRAGARDDRGRRAALGARRYRRSWRQASRAMGAIVRICGRCLLCEINLHRLIELPFSFVACCGTHSRDEAREPEARADHERDRPGLRRRREVHRGHRTPLAAHYVHPDCKATSLAVRPGALSPAIRSAGPQGVSIPRPVFTSAGVLKYR